jgi:hypothetical protein
MLPAEKLHNQSPPGVSVNNAEFSDHSEVLLAEQYLAPRQGNHQALRRLMVALLEDAIRTYQRHLFAATGHGCRLFLEAERWLMDDHPDAALRFQDVCEALDLDADFLRNALQRWRANEEASVIPERPRRGGSAKTGCVTRLEMARRRRVFAPPRSWARRWR